MEWEIIRQPGKFITLLTLAEFNDLHPDQVLINIFGEQKKKQYCSDDT
jgi:hypothetical protein